MTSGPRVEWDGVKGWDEDDVDPLEAQEEKTVK